MRRSFLYVFTVAILLLSLGCTATDTSAPTSFRGFVGEIQGRVLSVHDEAFIIRINRITEIREDNESPRPGVAEGHEFVVHPRRVIDRQGETHPDSAHVSFINTLSSDRIVTIRVKHVSGNQLEIISLADSR